MVRGRRIAFDHGLARIGVAICDPDGILATPVPFLDARHPKLFRNIAILLIEYEPVTIFVGRPKHLSGADGQAVSLVEDFAKELSTISDVPIIFVDERLSTIDAARKLQAAGKSARESKLLIDSMAAVSILETGLAYESK